MQLLDVSKNGYIILIGLGLFKIEIATEKRKILSETLLNIFHNLIPHKIKNVDSKTPKWINKSIKLSLKKQSKLTKWYHSNCTANNKEALDFHGKEYTSLIIESKERYIAKMNAKLDNTKTISKTYWSIINNFSSNKKLLLYQLLLLTVN